VRCHGAQAPEIPGIDTQFSQYIEDNVDEAVSGIKSELAIKVFGPDTFNCKNRGPDRGCRQKVPGAADVGTDC
jgi:heavy metal efflux system protein